MEDMCKGHTCGENGDCVGLAAGQDPPYECNCHDGYTAAEQTGPCEDDDECTTNPCHEHATCTNNPGSYDCSCNVDYVGDGFNCQVGFKIKKKSYDKMMTHRRLVIYN